MKERNLLFILYHRVEGKFWASREAAIFPGDSNNIV